MRRRLRAVSRTTWFVEAASFAVSWTLRAVMAAQRRVAGSSDARAELVERHPAIVGLWHGQHLLAPVIRPRDLPYVALLSRNADAEVNARVVERFGIETIRGSGGRAMNPRRKGRINKGGARALIGLRRALDAGRGVCMIADISKGTPRRSGMGIVTLAKISGRPILPSAAATSHAYVVESAWDKARLPLPFGRLAVVIGDPIHVSADADDAEMEAKRQSVTEAIEAANRRALDLVGARP